MAEPAPTVQCGNPDCKVGQTNKCVEGLALEQCPHFGKSPQPKVTIEAIADETHGVLLPSGDLMRVEDADRVLRRRQSRVIAIVGPKGAGKTTLIASIFELFLRGAIGPFRFSSSNTLYAFERACHPSRAISQNIVPQTERTILSGVHFYHLATRKDDDPSTIDMLLADRGGEDYRGSADDPSLASGFAEILRADTITFLLDGHQLLDLTTRSSITSEIIAIAQALIDGEAITGKPRAAIVLTKLDEIRRSPDNDRVMRDFRRLTSRFEDLFGGVFREIKPFEVAACPSDTSLPLGHGTLLLLDYWQLGHGKAGTPVPPYVSSSTRFMHVLRSLPEELA